MPTFYIYPLIITKKIKNFINSVHYSIHQIVFRQNWNHRGSIHWTTCSSSHWSLRTTLLIWKNVSTPWTNMEISLTQQNACSESLPESSLDISSLKGVLKEIQKNLKYFRSSKKRNSIWSPLSPNFKYLLEK